VITVEGVAQTIARFVTMEGEALVSAEPAARAGAEPILADALDRVAVDTGDLRDSLHIESRLDGETGQADVIAGTDHAVFVEFSPDDEPFLRPAADAAHGDAVGAVQDVIVKVLG
jgi:hypothetical protein